MKITTLPVYSKLANEKDIPIEVRGKLPKGWKLSQHQLETYLALTQGNADVIFNTAMTGDGKSLAGQLPTLMRGGIDWPVLAMYPTNELIGDQEIHLGQTREQWKANVDFGVLNSAELDRIMLDDDYNRRGDALMMVFRNRDFVLSNPDIFHYVMHQFYTYPQDAPDRYSAPLSQKFRQLIFDEFHIFDAPQIVSVLNALLFIHEISGDARKHKFLFLSATPGKLMLEYLNRSGLKVQQVEGAYSTTGETEHWRKILNPAEINFESELKAEEWVEKYLDDILLPFFLERRPNAKGAIIVNSVAAALRIYEKIKPVFEQHGLRVEPNTGLTSRSNRKISYQADLLIGTSTVDVGVDFQINFLVFESRDAGSFLQRLGRLGRHGGYQRDGQTYKFYDYVAYALMPDWIIKRLFVGKDNTPALLSENDTVDRQKLNMAVNEAFPPATDFEQYARCWGKFQTIKLLWGLGRKPIRDQYQDTRERLQKRYDETFNFHLSSAFKKYKELAESSSPLLDDALSFRGGSEFTCCVIDTSEPNQQEKFKTVSLLQMIANHNLEYLSEAEFYLNARKDGLNQAFFEKQEPLGFFTLYGPQEYQKFIFRLDKDLLYWGAEKYGIAQSVKGFRLDANFPGLNEINNRLRRRELPALLCAGLHPLDIKRRLSLPLLFPLYEFESRDGVKGTVAFGRTALMLESRLLYQPFPVGGNTIIA
ncbi:type I-D CRISPR-associated helicase Cas3' [bacterium]|nr:type I-D CRISPR-associated helicase Cas3' [bacterium]